MTKEEEEEVARDLAALINKHGLDNAIGIADYILAHFLLACLSGFWQTNNMRKTHQGVKDVPVQVS